MHRSILVPRAIVMSLVLAWLLSGSLVHAQGPAPGVRPLVIQVGTTQTIEMASKLPVLEIRESNPKVARAMPGPAPNLVLITGLVPGQSTVTLTDVKKTVEVLDVFVTTDDRRLMEAARKNFLAAVKQIYPTANIDAVPAGTNTVVLKGTVANTEDVPGIIDVAKGNFGTAAIIVNSMTLPSVQLVQLQVVVARVNRSEARNMSFSFLGTYTDPPNAFTLGSILRSSTLTNGATLASATAAATSQFAATGGNIPLAFVTEKVTGTGFLEALRTEGLAKIVAEPTVVTLSGKPAQIVSGGETPILTSSGTGAPTVTYKDFGTRVDFLPIVLGNGKIHLEVRPELSALNQANGITLPGATLTSVPGFDKRSASVSVQMEDGQTLAIGGLIQNTINAVTTKVPILGDLPFLGAAFRSTSYTEAEEELLILVTPRVVNPMDCTQLPKYLPGRETRTPDDFELFLEGILEAPRGPREVGLFGDAAHMFGGSQYPCGDSCDGRGGRGGRCSLPGCKRCQSVIHTASPAVPPVHTAGTGRVMSRRIQPAVAEEAPGTVMQIVETNPATFAVPVPEVKELPIVPPVVTPVATPAPQPAPVRPAAEPVRETPGWSPPPVNTPLPVVPPVSELRRDLN